jgi:hypothetical protein
MTEVVQGEASPKVSSESVSSRHGAGMKFNGWWVDRAGVCATAHAVPAESIDHCKS